MFSGSVRGGLCSRTLDSGGTAFVGATAKADGCPSERALAVGCRLDSGKVKRKHVRVTRRWPMFAGSCGVADVPAPCHPTCMNQNGERLSGVLAPSLRTNT